MSRQRRHWEDCIFDIINAAEYIEGFIQDVTFNEFIKNQETNFAVIRSLEIIQERAKGIPYHIRKDYPGIPWQDMAIMKDSLVHRDFGIDLKEAWRAVTEDVPSIEPKLREIITGD